MSLKKFLMVGVAGILIGFSSPAFSKACGLGGICFFGDLISAVANYLLHASQEKLMNPIYDVHKGLEIIKENIGMYQSKGKCGRSATGNTGCDLVSDAEGAQMQAEALQGLTPALLEGATAMMDADLMEKLEAQGDIRANRADFDQEYLAAIGLEGDADTFDRVRANVVAHVFETDVEQINSTCKCSAGTGSDCDATECAQQRQNDLLVVSSTGASANADGYLRSMQQRYAELKGYVGEINAGSKVVADYVGNLGLLSVYASTAAAEQMVILTYDLRTQSYRNLIFSGNKEIKEEDLSNLGGGN